VGVDGYAVRQVPGVMQGLRLPLLAEAGDLDRPFATEQALAELKAMSAAKRGPVPETGPGPGADQRASRRRNRRRCCVTRSASAPAPTRHPMPQE
jgi:hypothetical protein